MSNVVTVRSEFQSRNRGSFDFKKRAAKHNEQTRNQVSFNLVIEVLLISSTRYRHFWNEFQSRNRGSFDFKTGFAVV